MPRRRPSGPVFVEETLFQGDFVDTLVSEHGQEGVYAELGLKLPQDEVVRQELARAAVNPRMSAEVVPTDNGVETAASIVKAEMPLDIKNVDPATSIWLLHNEYGFYGRDSKEKASMWGILGRSGDNIENPVVRYLHDVERKQVKNGAKDPAKATHSITREFEEYAVQADREARIARIFDARVKSRGTPDQVFSDAFTMDDYRNDEQTRRTLTSAVRYIETQLFSELGVGQNPLHVREGVDSMAPKDRDKYVYSILSTMTLREVWNYSDKVRTTENARFEFWRTQLVKARVWAPVRAQVEASVKNLDEIRPRRAA